MQWKNEVRTAMLLGHPLFPFHCACQAQPISVSANNTLCCTTACSSPLGHELKQKLLQPRGKCSSEELAARLLPGVQMGGMSPQRDRQDKYL